MFESLGVKWPEFIAQLISFSLVFFVLNKLAFKRIAVVLAERRQKIAESLAGADKIKAEVAKTEADRQKILADAGETANKMIAEAREAAARVRESETQKAIAAAEQIVTKAREAAAQEREQMLAQLKREVGQLVVKTTATVTGKVLTADDQKRLADETQKQLS
ncbi:MAG TPA: F0F1 ATP synthase subunit B [Candidatus Sulfotelmatobacter sp.]|jgi:F-type H+-transporting ATPase subunit b|nr:F0F1 ATP synthase subunit B [Candidatus Sulfotelmatobacter sp.]